MDLREQVLRFQGGICPVCEKVVTIGAHLHHWLIGRNKNKPELNDPMNLLLLCPSCHVPPAPRMGYKCARFVLERTNPQVIESWRDGLSFKVPIELPEFYYEAREELYGY